MGNDPQVWGELKFEKSSFIKSFGTSVELTKIGVICSAPAAPETNKNSTKLMSFVSTVAPQFSAVDKVNV